MAYVNPKSVSEDKKVNPNRLEILMTMGKMGFMGDEIFLGSEKYLFSTVTKTQPTILYRCERHKLEKAWGMLGEQAANQIKVQSAQRVKYRVYRQKMYLRDIKKEAPDPEEAYEQPVVWKNPYLTNLAMHAGLSKYVRFNEGRK